MQHLQRGPERVHLCQRNKPKSCHIEIKHTKVQQSRFVITIVSRDRLCSHRVISANHSEHVPAAPKSRYRDWGSEAASPSPAARLGRKQTICLRHVIDLTALPCTEQNVWPEAWLWVWTWASVMYRCIEPRCLHLKKANRPRRQVLSPCASFIVHYEDSTQFKAISWENGLSDSRCYWGSNRHANVIG